MTAMMRLLKRRRPARYGLVVAIALVIACVGFVRPRTARGDDQDIQKLNRFVQTSKVDTPAMKMFREGRDMIEAENWPQAAAKFKSFVNDYPKDKDVDAALYWLAYALQKQGRKDEAVAPLERLMKNFPNSGWRREAEALLVVLGRRDAIQQAFDRDNCEIKILALQSLFEADEDRAINFVTDVLRANSTECPALRAAAVSLLGSHGGARAVPILIDIARNQPDMKLRLTAIKRLGEQNSDTVADDLARLYDTDRTPEVRSQILRALSEMHSPRAESKLIEVATSGDDLSLRQTAIRRLGERDSPNTLDALIRLYDTDRTAEIRAQILRALSERDDPRARTKLLDVARRGETPELRVYAIRRLGERGSTALEDLLGLYATENSDEIKQGLLRAYSEMNDPRAQAKLYEVARGAEKLDLRLYAIRRLGEHDNAQAVDELLGMYDAEQNVEVRGALIRAFGESHQKSAIRKLIAIARNDQSVDLRKLAIRLLGESKDAEALKFLEELLK
ncbi:MAG TPA: HEAT repeat domain-containing protein [Pyrinomonadaceae bacterium]|jgi:HEAT repeat protein